MSNKKAASGPSAAMELRTFFGDRKVPDISRKITACVTCRRLKIKCNMTHAKPPCARCKAQNLSCVVNKSLQTLLEGDATWKEAMERRIEKIEEAMFHAVQPDSTDTPVAQEVVTKPRTHISKGHSSGYSALRSTAVSTPETTLDLSCSLGAFPASSIASTSPGQPLDAPFWPDLISRGIISLPSAQKHFAYFQRHLNPSIHYALDRNSTIGSIRSRCSLLTTAICAVASLCTGSEDYSKCLDELKEEVGRKLFADSYIFDDALALCIGALWLRDISTSLQSFAVRVSSQLDLHRCITKMPHTDISCYRRTRLFFLVLLCDHHCSLVCGKPPMTQDWKCLKHPATLLQSEFSTNEDLFLVCQVELWALNRQVFETFGADVCDTTATRNSQGVERLNDAYKAWYYNWRRALNLVQEPIPRLHYIFELYYHSGRLYLLSHVFRGQAAIPESSRRNATNPKAQAAFNSALCIIETITTWQDACEWLNALPWYFCTMLAFACVCIIRMCFQLREVSEMDVTRARDQLARLTSILRRIPSVRQPLVNVADCLETALFAEQQQGHGRVLNSTSSTFDAGADFNWDTFWNESIQTDLLGDEAMWMDFLNDSNL